MKTVLLIAALLTFAVIFILMWFGVKLDLPWACLGAACYVGSKLVPPGPPG